MLGVQQWIADIAKVCCSRLLLTHSANAIILTIVFVRPNRTIYLARLFCVVIVLEVLMAVVQSI